MNCAAVALEDVAAEVAGLLAPHGLLLRGGFDFRTGEETPSALGGRPALSVLLVGQAGDSIWARFERWRAENPDTANPLDAWSREVIGAAAQSAGARAVSPSDRPFLPFQQWAMRAEGLRPSPLGVLMHPEYGLWHAYRGALLFDRRIGLSAPAPAQHACDRCREKPCLTACPVGAYSAEGFAYVDCLAHVRSPAGGICSQTGCLARNACPHGTAYRYRAGQQAFHMAAFAGAD